MPALAMGLGWAGYTLGLWGYCLVRGYDVTLFELIDFRHVPTWASITASKAPASGSLTSVSITTGVVVSIFRVAGVASSVSFGVQTKKKEALSIIGD